MQAARELAWGLDGAMSLSQFGFNYDFNTHGPVSNADISLSPSSGSPLSTPSVAASWRDRQCAPALGRVQACDVNTATVGGAECIGCYGYLKRHISYELVTAWGEVQRAEFRVSTDVGFGMSWKLTDWASPYRVSRTQTVLPTPPAGSTADEWVNVFDRVLHVGGIPVRFAVGANVLMALHAGGVFGGSLSTPAVHSAYTVVQGFTYDRSLPQAERMSTVRSARRTGEWVTTPADLSSVTGGGDAEVTAQLAMGVRVVMGEVLPMSSWVVPTVTTVTTAQDPSGACQDTGSAAGSADASVLARSRSRFSLAGVTWMRDENLWPEDLSDLAAMGFSSFKVNGRSLRAQDVSPEGAAFRVPTQSPAGADAHINTQLPSLVNEELPGYTLLYHLSRHQSLGDRCVRVGALTAGASSSRPEQLAPELVSLSLAVVHVNGLDVTHGVPSVRVLASQSSTPVWAVPKWGDGATAAPGTSRTSVLEASGRPGATAGNFDFSAEVSVLPTTGIARAQPGVSIEVQSAAGGVMDLLQLPALPVHCAALSAPHTCTRNADGSLNVVFVLAFSPASGASSGTEQIAVSATVAPFTSAGAPMQLVPGQALVYTVAEGDSLVAHLPLTLAAAGASVSLEAMRVAGGAAVIGTPTLFVSASTAAPSSGSNDGSATVGGAPQFAPAVAAFDAVSSDAEYGVLRAAALNDDGALYVSVHCGSGMAASAGVVSAGLAASGAKVCQFTLTGHVQQLPALGVAALLQGAYAPGSAAPPKHIATAALASSRAVGFFSSTLGAAASVPGRDADLDLTVGVAGDLSSAAGSAAQWSAPSTQSSAKWASQAGASYAFADATEASRLASLAMPFGQERLFTPCTPSATLAAAVPTGATNIGAFGICSASSQLAVADARVNPLSAAGRASTGDFKARLSATEVLHTVSGETIQGTVAAGGARVYAMRLPSNAGRLSLKLQRRADVCARRPMLSSGSASSDDLRMAQLMLQAAMGGFLGSPDRAFANGDWSDGTGDLVRAFRLAFDVPQSASRSSGTIDENVWVTLCALPAAKGLSSAGLAPAQRASLAGATTSSTAAGLGETLPEEVLGGNTAADSPAQALVELTVLDAVTLTVLASGTSDASSIDVQFRVPGQEGVAFASVHQEGQPSFLPVSRLRPAGGSTDAAAGQMAHAWYRHGMEAANSVLLVVGARGHWSASYELSSIAVAPLVPGVPMHFDQPLHSWVHFEIPLHQRMSTLAAHAASAAIVGVDVTALNSQLLRGAMNETLETLLPASDGVAVLPQLLGNPSYMPLYKTPAVEADPFAHGRAQVNFARYPSAGSALLSSTSSGLRTLRFKDASGAALGGDLQYVRTFLTAGSDDISVVNGSDIAHATTFVFALKAVADSPRTLSDGADFSAEWAPLDFSIVTSSFQALASVDLSAGVSTSSVLPRGGYASYSLKLAPGAAGVCLRVVPLRGQRPGNPDLVITESTRPRDVVLPPYTLSRSVNVLDELLDDSSAVTSVQLPGSFSLAGAPSTTNAAVHGAADPHAGMGMDAALRWYDALERSGHSGDVVFANGTWAARDPRVSAQWFAGQFGADIVTGWGGRPHSMAAPLHSSDLQTAWAKGQSFAVASGQDKLSGVSMASAAPWHIAVHESAGGMHAISASALNEWPVAVSGDLVPLASEPDNTAGPARVQAGGARLVLELACDTFVRDAVDEPELRAALVAGFMQNPSLAGQLSLAQLASKFEHPRGGSDVTPTAGSLTTPGSWDAVVVPALYRSASMGYSLAAKHAQGFFGGSGAVAIGRSLTYDPAGTSGYVKRFNGNTTFDENCGGRGQECFQGGPGSTTDLDSLSLSPVGRLLFKYAAEFSARPHIPDTTGHPTVVTQGFDTVVLMAATAADAAAYVSGCSVAVTPACYWDRDTAAKHAEGALLLAEQAVRERFAGKLLNVNQFSVLVVQFATSGGSVWPVDHVQTDLGGQDWSGVCARMGSYINVQHNTAGLCYDPELVLVRQLECMLFWTPVATPDRDAPIVDLIRQPEAAWRAYIPSVPSRRVALTAAYFLASQPVPAELSTAKCPSSRRAQLLSAGGVTAAPSTGNTRQLNAPGTPEPTIIKAYWQVEAPPADLTQSFAPSGMRPGVPALQAAGITYTPAGAGVVHGDASGTIVPFDNSTAYTDKCGGRGDACVAGGRGATTEYDQLWTTQRGVELIRHFEGWTPYAYHGAYDAPGVVSIGYGHVLASQRTARGAHSAGFADVTEPEMDAWLVEDIGQAEACVRRYAGDVPLNSNQFSALVSFVFSVGCHRFADARTSKMQAALRALQFNKVCSEFRRWSLARGGTTVAGGMVKRRHAECILFWTPVGEQPDQVQPLHAMPVTFDVGLLLPPGFTPGDDFSAFNLTVDASMPGSASGGPLAESSRAFVLAHNASLSISAMSSAQLQAMYGAVLGAPRVTRAFPPVLAAGMDAATEPLNPVVSGSGAEVKEGAVPDAAVFRRHSPTRISITLPALPDFEPAGTVVVSVSIPGALLTSGVTTPTLGHIVIVPDGVDVEMFKAQQEMQQLSASVDSLQQAAAYRDKWKAEHINPSRKFDSTGLQIMAEGGDSAKTLAFMAAQDEKRRTRRELRQVARPDGGVEFVEHRLSDAEMEELENTGARRIMAQVHGRRAQMIWRETNDLRWGKTLMEAVDECHMCNLNGVRNPTACNSGRLVKGLTAQMIAMLNCVHGSNIFTKMDSSHAIWPFVTLGVAVEEVPYLQTAVVEALKKKVEMRRREDAGNSNIKITINSGLRSVAQQQVLRRWKSIGGGCGISATTVVGKPGGSAHQSGRAIDMPHTPWHGWKQYFLRRTAAADGGVWLEVPNDTGHFNVPQNFPGVVDVRTAAIKGFQMLWNLNVNNPQLKLDVDGSYGSMGELAMHASPADGFPIGAPADCAVSASDVEQQPCPDCDRTQRTAYMAFFRSAVINFAASRVQPQFSTVLCKKQMKEHGMNLCGQVTWDPNDPETPWSGDPLTTPAAGSCDESSCDDDEATATPAPVSTSNGGSVFTLPWSCNTDDGEGNAQNCPLPGWLPFVGSSGNPPPTTCRTPYRCDATTVPPFVPNPSRPPRTGGIQQSVTKPLDNAKCNPAMSAAATNLLNRLQQEGMRVQAIHCWRSWADMTSAKASGATRFGPGESWHSYGLAISVVMNYDNKWGVSHIPSADWDRFAELGYAFGFTLAGRDDPAERDVARLQYHPGYDGSTTAFKEFVRSDSTTGLHHVWTQLGLPTSRRQLLEAESAHRVPSGAQRSLQAAPMPQPAHMAARSQPASLRRALTTCNGGPAASASPSPEYKPPQPPLPTPTPIPTDPSACPAYSFYSSATGRCTCLSGYFMTRDRACESLSGGGIGRGGSGSGTTYNCTANAYFDPVDSKCACIGGFAMSASGTCLPLGDNGGGNGGSLACPPHAYSVQDGAGSATCVCKEGLVLQGGLCLPCPANSQEVNGICLCADGFAQVDGVCAPCPPGATAVSGRCECEGDDFAATAVGQCARCPAHSEKEDSSGFCRCTGSKYDSFWGRLRAGLCLPPASTSGLSGSVAPANSSHCPAYAQFTSAAEACFCQAGYYMSGGECHLCPVDSTDVRGTCSCDAGFARSPVTGLCVACGPHQVVKGGQCICATGYTMINAQCVSLTAAAGAAAPSTSVLCPPNSAYNAAAGMCLCTGKRANFGGQCVDCPGNSHVDGGSCVCNTGFVRDRNQLCVPCPANSREEEGQCVCDSSYEMVDEGCVPTDRVVSASTATCPTGSSYDDRAGRCDCSSGVQHAGQCLACTAAERAVQHEGQCFCRLGSVKKSDGSWPCDLCPPGRRSVDGQCACLPGSTLAHGVCVPDRNPTRPVVACPANAYFDATAGSCVCATGMVMFGHSCVAASAGKRETPLTAADCKVFGVGPEMYYDEHSHACVCPAGHVHSAQNSSVLGITRDCLPDLGSATKCPSGQTYNAHIHGCTCKNEGASTRVNGLCVATPYGDSSGVPGAAGNSTDSNFVPGQGCPPLTHWDGASGRCECNKNLVLVDGQCKQISDDAFGNTDDDGSPYTGLWGSGASYGNIGQDTVPDSLVDDAWWNGAVVTDPYEDDDFKWSSGTANLAKDDTTTNLFQQNDGSQFSWTDDDWGVWDTKQDDDTLVFRNDDGSDKFNLITDDDRDSVVSGSSDDSQWWTGDTQASTSDPNGPNRGGGANGVPANAVLNGQQAAVQWPWQTAAGSASTADSSGTFWGGALRGGPAAAQAPAGSSSSSADVSTTPMRARALDVSAWNAFDQSLWGEGAQLTQRGVAVGVQRQLQGAPVSPGGHAFRVQLKPCGSAWASGSSPGFCASGYAGAAPDSTGAVQAVMKRGLSSRQMQPTSRAEKMPVQPMVTTSRIGHVLHGAGFDRAPLATAASQGINTGNVSEMVVSHPNAVCMLPSLTRVVHQLTDDVKCLMPDALVRVSSVPGLQLLDRAADLPLLQSRAWRALSDAVDSQLAAARKALYDSSMATAKQAWLDALPASAFEEGGRTIANMPPLPLSPGNAAGTSNIKSLVTVPAGTPEALLPSWPRAEREAAAEAAEAASANVTLPALAITTLYRSWAEHAVLASNGLCGLKNDIRSKPVDPEPIDAFGKGYLAFGTAFQALADSVTPQLRSALEAQGWRQVRQIVTANAAAAATVPSDTPVARALAHGLVEFVFRPEAGAVDVYGAGMLGFQLRWNHNVARMLLAVNAKKSLAQRRLLEDGQPSSAVLSALELVPVGGLEQDGACGCPARSKVVGSVRVISSGGSPRCFVEKSRQEYPTAPDGSSSWDIASPTLCAAYSRWAAQCKSFLSAGKVAPQRFTQLAGADSTGGSALVSSADQAVMPELTGLDDFSASNDAASPLLTSRIELEEAGRGTWGSSFEDERVRADSKPSSNMLESITVSDAVFSGWKNTLGQPSTAPDSWLPASDDVFVRAAKGRRALSAPARRALAAAGMSGARQRELGLFDWLKGYDSPGQQSYTTSQQKPAPQETGEEMDDDAFRGINGPQAAAANSIGTLDAPGEFDTAFLPLPMMVPGGPNYPFDPETPPNWLADNGKWLFGNAPSGFENQAAPAGSSRDNSGTGSWGFNTQNYNEAFGDGYNADDAGSFFGNSLFGASYSSTQAGGRVNTNSGCVDPDAPADGANPLNDPLFNDDAFADDDDNLPVPNGPACQPAGGSAAGGSVGNSGGGAPASNPNGCGSQYEYKDTQTNSCECVTGFYRRTPTAPCERFQSNTPGRTLKDFDPKGVLDKPEVHPEVRRIAQRAAMLLQADGFDPYIFEGYRSWARQDQLYAQGGVTNAEGGESWHNYGLALDFTWYDPTTGRGPSWLDHSTLTAAEQERHWNALGAKAKQAGFEWGGDWTSFKDRPHVQYRGSYSSGASSLQSVYNGASGAIIDKLQAVWTHAGIGVASSAIVSPSAAPLASPLPPGASASSTAAATPSTTSAPAGNPNKPACDPKGELNAPEVHPQVKILAMETCVRAQNQGYEPYVFQCYRSVAEQDRLYNQGGVTKVSGGGSYHNYGLACDIIFYDPVNHRQPSWLDRTSLTAAQQTTYWNALGAAGKAAGFTVWGGDWTSFVDRPHFQYHPGQRNRARDLEAHYRAGKQRTGTDMGGLEAAWTFLGIGPGNAPAASPSAPAAARPTPSRTPTRTAAATPSSSRAPRASPSPSNSPDPPRGGTTTVGSGTCATGGASSQGLAAYSDSVARASSDLCGGRGNNCHSGGCGATSNLNLLHTVDTAIDLIKEEEGQGTTKMCGGQLKLCPYIGSRDPPHIVTQGYGKVVHRAAGNSASAARAWMNAHSSCDDCWTDQEATDILREHVEETAEGTVRRIMSGVSLNKHQFSALVSAFYNVGSFGRSADDSGYPFHSDEFKYACKGSFNLFINARANGVKCYPLGLVRRRIRECVLFWTPDDETPQLPDRSQINSVGDPRLPPNQGYPTRLSQYYGKTNPC